MNTEARTVSWIDGILVQFHLSVPVFVLGLVAPNRLVLSFLARRNTGGGTVRFLRRLRDKYGCDHLWVRFPLRKTLLVMSPWTMDEVLASTDNAPDPWLKKRALSRFVPGALVISSSEEARSRRPFNTHALDLGKLHRHSETFFRVASAETARFLNAKADIRWEDFQRLAQAIAHQVILGIGQTDPSIGDHLARVLPSSNLLLRNRASFVALYRQIEAWLARNESSSSGACLVHDAVASRADGSADDSTRMAAQVGFWFFVLKDALELHVARTLALIAAHPEVQSRVRREVRAAGPLTAESIDGLVYLERCIREQLRLWTPVPLLLRRAESSFSLCGIGIEAEEQILIHAASYHRDPQVWGAAADTFSPDTAATAQSPKSYVFSDHGRGCAGKSLVLFMLKATLAPLLDASAYELTGPSIDVRRIPHLYDHFAIAIRPVAAA